MANCIIPVIVFKSPLSEEETSVRKGRVMRANDSLPPDGAIP